MNPLTLAFLALSATAVGSQPPDCAPRAAVVQRLSEKYGETQRSIGLQNELVMVEVFASSETGTWTILLTRADGTSCLLAVGKFWEAVPPPKPGVPS